MKNRLRFYRSSLLTPLAIVIALTAVVASCGDDGGGTKPPDGGADPDGGGIDGGTDAGPTPEVVVETCTGAPTASPGDDVCAVTAGDDRILLVGDVLQPGRVYEQGGILLDASGNITCVGCDCFAEASGATEVVCPDAVISPGLINAHDHVGWMNGRPWVATEHSVDPSLRWEHRHDWRCGKNGNPEIDVNGGGASTNEKTYGELRFVLSGTTAIFGSGDLGGILRDFDDTGSGDSGLNHPGAEYDTFPLGDANCTTAESGCTAYDMPSPVPSCWAPHVAEGIGASARNELHCLTGQGPESAEVLDDNSAIIHGVGVNAPDVAMMAQKGIKLIWSPRSNVALYGDTAPVTLYDRLGITIGMGTDWLPSGSMNMLRELACAASLNENNFGGYFSAHKLWRMATEGSARALAFDDVTGVLRVGLAGDIAVFRNDGSSHFGAVVGADVVDVALVLRGGEVLSGNAAVVTALESGCDAIDVCGTMKQVCVSRDTGMTLDELLVAVGTQYPLFFCTEPDNEPSCLPARTLPGDEVNGSGLYSGTSDPADPDGDGIGDGDNCPNIFNPIRPVDEGQQADFDGDGEGDVCDPCPLDADITDCSTFDPNDSDGDGVANLDDNCPQDPNPDQEDADNDDKGDACDDCPNEPNPGLALCSGTPATIYEVQDVTHANHPAEGTRVQVSCIITAVTDTRAWCQDAGGGAYSGIVVYVGVVPTYAGATPVAVGDSVIIDGDYVEYYDVSRLDQPMLTFVAAATVPDPVVVQSADVATGGASAEEYEGVLIEVQQVTVTVENPDAPSDYDEFEVTGGLRIDDQAYPALDNTFPAGTTFTSITGVHHYGFSHYKLLPRSATDIVLGAPVVDHFGPAEVFVEVGGGVLPSELTIYLSGLAQGPTVIDLVSSDPTVLTVPTTVTVPDSQDYVVIPLTGNIAQLASVTVTASHTVDSALYQVDGIVYVYDDSLTRSIDSLSPDNAQVLISTTPIFTVTLDLPAPTGGATVSLSTSGGIGTVLATVVVAAGTFSADFQLTAAGAAANGLITATLGPSNASVSVEVMDQPLGDLVINEVDYDQPGTDTAEFVEIYNGTLAPISLVGYQLIFVNGGTGAVYRTVDLGPAGTLSAGGFLVVHTAGVTPDAAALSILESPTTNYIQNGGPDGIALVSATALVDALSYEGSITAADLGAPYGIQNLVSGNAESDADTADGSLSRIVDGVDSLDDDADWSFTTTSTPGFANVIN